MDTDAVEGKCAETLVLFSDGTGNSSAKLFKTNVWRMYEAVDLGISRTGAPVQIAYYDNGVGTQSIKLLAIPAGIFGFGLKANVLRLYRFACRNGAPGCRIYCFGFSRGAFTIRLVAAIIAQYGIVQYTSEAELKARTLDVFRRFMRGNNPNVLAFVGNMGRAVRDASVAVKRALFGPRLPPLRTFEAEIQFLGVWDTVAAYGGPIAEITRGIDDYIWPLTMTDTCLSDNVRIARHALSLDDERDSFQPVLWDEVDWARRAKRRHPDDAEAERVFRERMKQVWFAGMHSDVGGGYPDESLSYVSLYWMMEEAEKAGLRLLPRFKANVRSLSNSLGPIHDSRAGFASYYRPQPRKIIAFLHPDSGMDFETETLSLRDPVLGELPKPPHGLLLGCRVHESIITRLLHGTDDYAPATLPPKIEIEPFSRSLRREGGNPQVDEEISSRLTETDMNWFCRQERIWDHVLWRRAAYFTTIVLTLLLVAMPLWVEGLPYPSDQDGRAVMQRLTSWSQYVPVAWLAPWIHAFEVNWVAFITLLAGAVLFGWVGGWWQARTRTLSYRLWRERVAGVAYTLPGPGAVTAIRNSRAYQRTLQVVKWRALPAVAAATLAFAVSWLLLALATQVAWAFKEPGLCNPSGSEPVPFVAKSFSTKEDCFHLLAVERGHRYEIAIRIDDEWLDGGVPADPIGVRSERWQDSAHPPDWRTRANQLLAAPYRRLLDGRYLQPVVKLRAADSQKGQLPRTVVHLLNPITTDGKHYRDTYEMPADGDLYLFVNDAAFLGEHRASYDDNEGTAEVTVIDLDGRGARPPDVARPD